MCDTNKPRKSLNYMVIKSQFWIVHCHMTVPTTRMGTFMLGGLARGHQKGLGLVTGLGKALRKLLGLEARSPNSLRGVCLHLATAVPLLPALMIQPGHLLAPGRHLGASRPRPPPPHQAPPHGPSAGSGLMQPTSTWLSPQHAPPAACLGPLPSSTSSQTRCLLTALPLQLPAVFTL